MSMSEAAVSRARALIGSRFRQQGHDPAFGLDCLGLVLAAHEVPGGVVGRDYALRGIDRKAMEQALGHWFRRVAPGAARDGDVLLLQVGRSVLHLGLKSGDGMVHADIRRGIVERPGEPPWPVVGVYRRRVRHRLED